MLVAPSEPAALKHGLRGTSSSVPEKYGADVLFPSATYGAVGIQRKEVNDLVASVMDGRLKKEFAQMKQLGLGVLLVEGRVLWTADGLLMSRTRFSKSQMRGVLWKASSLGYWTIFTDGLTDTIESTCALQKWCAKEKHGSLGNRAGVKAIRGGAWGTVDNRDYGIHLLQGFDGMGQERAALLYDRYGVPLNWTVTKKEMMGIDKFGKITVDRLFKALRQYGMEG